MSGVTIPTLAALLIFTLIRGLADTENFDLSLPLWLAALIGITLRAGASSAVRRAGVVLTPLQENSDGVAQGWVS